MKLFLAALCFLIVPIQMQWAGAVALAGIRPDLPGVVVYAMGLALGPWAGGAAGALVGLLVDRFSAGPVGPQFAAKLFIGAAGGVLTHRLLLTKPSAHAGVALLLFTAQGIWMTWALWWRTGRGWSELYLTALPEACYTAFVIMCGLWLAQPWWRPAGDRATDRLAVSLDR